MAISLPCFPPWCLLSSSQTWLARLSPWSSLDCAISSFSPGTRANPSSFLPWRSQFPALGAPAQPTARHPWRASSSSRPRWPDLPPAPIPSTAPLCLPRTRAAALVSACHGREHPFFFPIFAHGRAWPCAVTLPWFPWHSAVPTPRSTSSPSPSSSPMALGRISISQQAPCRTPCVALLGSPMAAERPCPCSPSRAWPRGELPTGLLGWSLRAAVGSSSARPFRSPCARPWRQPLIPFRCPLPCYARSPAELHCQRSKLPSSRTGCDLCVQLHKSHAL
jgi:hypothetical protein|uniref:Uncharacterized protein n=1 Tax=Zea mays TaxID=4577 RepID=A0A804Q8F9_MAIZE